MTFAVSKAVTLPTVFLVRRSRLQGRLDVEYNFALLKTRISSNYPQLKLREIARFRTGRTPSKSRPEYWEGKIPWATPKDFGSFHLTRTKDCISKDAVLDVATTVVPAGTLLLVFRSDILRHAVPVTITIQETAINQDLKALSVGDAVSAEYVGAYFVVFGGLVLPLISKSGATVRSINTEQFETLDIPVPPKDVQDEVVAKLLTAYKTAQEKEDRARALRASLDDVLLDELGIRRIAEPPKRMNNRIFCRGLHELSGTRWDPKYSLCMDRFLKQVSLCSFPLYKLKEFLDLVQYGIAKRPTKGVVGVPTLRSSNLQDGAWDVSDMKYIAMDERERQPYILHDGDILFSRTNSKESVGICNVFDLQGEYVFASYLIRVRLKDESGLRPEYVVAYLGTSLGRMQIDAVSRQSVGMTNINAEEIRELLIPVPPRPVQDRICKRVFEIRQQASGLRAQAESELKATKKTIEALILGRDAA